jgi:polysaccharide pyruvyl transferase WcaK-like protein
MSRHPGRRRFALFGMFGVGNLGNECTLQAMLANLCRHLPDARVLCICGGPDNAALRYKVPTCPIRELSLPPTNSRAVRLLRRIVLALPMELYRWLRTFQKIAGRSMLIMTGTGMLSDVGIGPLGLHYDILRWAIAAKLCRCKVLFVSVGLGPIRHPFSRFLVKTALKLADYRSYRDSFSKTYSETLGCPHNADRVYPDLAFSLPRNLLPTRPPRRRRPMVIGVGLITYDGGRNILMDTQAIYQNYVANIGKFVQWLIEHNYTVRLLIGDAVYDNRVRQDLKAFLGQNGVNYTCGKIIDEPARSVDELLAQLAATDTVVASRFHNVLLALMLRRPVVAISFHEKVEALMSTVGLREFCQNIEYIDVDELIRQLVAIEENAAAVECSLENLSEVYRKNLEVQYKHIFDTLS